MPDLALIKFMLPDVSLLRYALLCVAAHLSANFAQTLVSLFFAILVTLGDMDSAFPILAWCALVPRSLLVFILPPLLLLEPFSHGTPVVPLRPRLLWLVRFSAWLLPLLALLEPVVCPALACVIFFAMAAALVFTLGRASLQQELVWLSTSILWTAGSLQPLNAVVASVLFRCRLFPSEFALRPLVALWTVRALSLFFTSWWLLVAEAALLVATYPAFTQQLSWLAASAKGLVSGPRGRVFALR